jgi:hypothetical protein
LFSFVGGVAQVILNVVGFHALALTDRARVTCLRIGRHVPAARTDAARPFLQPPFMEFASSKAAHVAALAHSLRSVHVRATHPVHIVACDCQIYLSMWNRIEEALGRNDQSLSCLVPVPGLFHLLWNNLECIYKLCWDTMLEPAAVVLGRRRPNKECRDFEACEQLLEVICYAIIRLFRTHFGQESILAVVDKLEQSDKPMHVVLFCFVHLFCPYFHLRALIRARNLSGLCDVLKCMLPTFVAAHHRNYASVVARFLISFNLAVPSVRVLMMESMACSLTPGALKGQASDLILERVREMARVVVV